ncbi:MAG: discoidin domain-containing protein [Acidimicrobiales bacterium]|nr:discoidin domain-containing protein [Acidimicrobiales bacterium]
MIAKRIVGAGRMRAGIAILGLIGLAVVACGGDTESATEVFAFEAIAADGPTIEPDPSGGFVTLTVTTNIDAVCAVAYGQTEDLGSLATDQDMGAAGHSDHEVVLGGLEPDTEYFYRLQGVGVDGRLYRSELLTFRTPPAAEVSPGRNLAPEADVTDVSSEFSEAFAAENAIDGDPSTEWSTRGDGDNAYIVLDLGRHFEVVAVGFHTRTMSDGTATTATFTVTVDNEETYGPYPVGRSEVTFAGQILRFDVEESTGGNTGATEIEIVAAPMNDSK